MKLTLKDGDGGDFAVAEGSPEECARFLNLYQNDDAGVESDGAQRPGDEGEAGEGADPEGADEENEDTRKHGSGRCGMCDRWIALRPNGKLFHHPPKLGAPVGERCPGSEGMPAAWKGDAPEQARQHTIAPTGLDRRDGVQRGECSLCHKAIAVNPGGDLRAHRTVSGEECPGSNVQPVRLGSPGGGGSERP